VADHELMVSHGLPERLEPFCLEQDLPGPRSELHGLVMHIPGRPHEDESGQPGVHHAPGNGTDVGRRLGVDEYDADVVEKALFQHG
jgi:hypothetical protein